MIVVSDEVTLITTSVSLSMKSLQKLAAGGEKRVDSLKEENYVNHALTLINI